MEKLYRAWYNNKMWYWDEKEWIEELYWNFVKNINTILSDKDIVWLQFTWLLDKNWKKIYEGDIVRRQTLIKKTNKEWFNYTEWEDRNLQVIYYNQSYYPNNLEESEIIWNIYENPDLLTNN